MSNYIIRACTEKDLADVAALEAAVFSDPWSEASLASDLANSNYKVLCLEADGVIAAYLIGCAIAGESEILRIAVRADFRRCGCGRALTEYFINERKNSGDFTMFLEVRASNVSAISLYESCGFSSYATRRGYYKNPSEDAVMMHLDLGN